MTEAKERTSNDGYSTNYAVAGAISGIATRALCQPFDVLKIRFQFQVYEVLKYEFKEVLKLEVKKNSAVHFVSGGLAGCVATIASFPFDIIRTRLVAQGNNKAYRGVLHGGYQICRQEGFLALWRGLSPALIVAGPLTGSQFAFYELFKRIVTNIEYLTVMDENGKSEASAMGNMLAGSVAGLSAKLATYPFDLARKRMQIQHFQHARVGFGKNFWCYGIISCFVKTLKTENMAGLYKGLMPSLIKAGVTSSLHFTFYEESLRLLSKYR